MDKGKQTACNTTTKYLNYLPAFSFHIPQRAVKSLRSIVTTVFHRGKPKEETKMQLFFFFFSYK